MQGHPFLGGFSRKGDTRYILIIKRRGSSEAVRYQAFTDPDGDPYYLVQEQQGHLIGGHFYQAGEDGFEIWSDAYTTVRLAASVIDQRLTSANSAMWYRRAEDAWVVVPQSAKVPVRVAFDWDWGGNITGYTDTETGETIRDVLVHLETETPAQATR